MSLIVSEKGTISTPARKAEKAEKKAEKPTKKK